MRLAIVVPVHHRPEAAAPFVTSLADSGWPTNAGLYVLPSPDDAETATAWLQQGVVHVDWRHGLTSFPDKVQHVYDELLIFDDVPEWYLLLGDDVRFHPGWYEAFLRAAQDPEAGLIASNDMGNPYVLMGTHATHPFISTKYVEEQGACWDGPGHIVHTGYRHSWVDEEWSVKSRHDGVFRYAPDCKIEHLHPTWNKGSQDATYAIARQYLLDDHALYQARHTRALEEGQA